MSRKLTVFALVLCMVLSLMPVVSFADAGTEDCPNIDWYFGQVEQPDCQMVNDYINEYLKEKVGATVTLHFWSGDQYWDNMTTMISSGQDVGIIGFGSQTKLDYVLNSQRGAYYPLEDMLGTIGADTKALFPDEIWDAMTIDGHIYGIPSKKDNGYYISLIYNATMAEELGIDMESYEYIDMRH
ncbi:MAG: ABC transporter substrate-binding protein, partial [Candidatus Fimadaptatus sp.]